MTARDTIPVIDVGPLLAGGDDGGRAVAAAIGRACRGIGFFYVTGHGIDADLRRRVFTMVATFFALPDDAKRAVSIERSKHNRGYVPLAGESLDPQRPADLKEGFNVGFELAPDDPDVVAGKPFCGVNQWPELPGFRATMLAYYERARRLGIALHRAFALDLGAAPETFAAAFERPMATLRLLHYPPQPASAAAGQIGAGAHTDYGNVTLLLQDDAGGLQVRARDGGWLDAPVIADAFVCNIGDLLMRWSNDVYVSTPHRVVNRSGRERYSVPFFLDPAPATEVACLPSCVAPERPARYPPITAARYLAERLDATYAFRSAG